MKKNIRNAGHKSLLLAVGIVAVVGLFYRPASATELIHHPQNSSIVAGIAMCGATTAVQRLNT